jgi:hypothetical protein
MGWDYFLTSNIDNIYIIIPLFTLIVYSVYTYIYYISSTTSIQQNKIKQIREEMLRVEYIQLLNSKIESVEKRGVLLSDYSQINKYMKSLYDNIDMYIEHLLKGPYIIIQERILPWIYKITT